METYYSKNKEKCLEYARKYRNKEGMRERQSIRYKKWYKKYGRKRNPLAQKAHILVNRALKEQKLEKSLSCQLCGKIAKYRKRPQRRIEGHHQDYLEPLRVIWVCSGCHKKLHR